jgi:hypothetical protein
MMLLLQTKFLLKWRSSKEKLLECIKSIPSIGLGSKLKEIVTDWKMIVRDLEIDCHGKMKMGTRKQDLLNRFDQLEQQECNDEVRRFCLKELNNELKALNWQELEHFNALKPRLLITGFKN